VGVGFPVAALNMLAAGGRGTVHGEEVGGNAGALEFAFQIPGAGQRQAFAGVRCDAGELVAFPEWVPMTRSIVGVAEGRSGLAANTSRLGCSTGRARRTNASLTTLENGSVCRILSRVNYTKARSRGTD
jgi:hypothetical protein